MSTFNGIVKEFPDIRIDYFRQSTQDARPPLIYFLSHVHSDHLHGLETCKSPFIYCSPTTKEILLRLEKYPHRMNFQKGILESRQQTYKHLRKLLKTIPLETPIEIELAPGRTIRVTLFDANHCVGAVMFLIEDERNAILYTGDIRSEIWWVNALTRHPLLLPYAHHAGRKPIKQLDCIYLDTTFANKSDPYKDFPSKAEGVSELLRKVSQYPEETIFYFDSWTFGYEDVWLALCSYLKCRVHVDEYRYKLYASLEHGADPKSVEGPWLSGFFCDFVRITPIISRHDGVEMKELGAGGGQGDLDQRHELELDDSNILGQLLSFGEINLRSQPALLANVNRMIGALLSQPVDSIAIRIAALHAQTPGGGLGDLDELDQMPLENFLPMLVKLTTNQQATQLGDTAVPVSGSKDTLRIDGLPKAMTFPYSRHSSYNELCHLIEAFRPTDIHPCTVDKSSWAPDQSMSFLFGHLYQTPCDFKHDQQMLRAMSKRPPSTITDLRSESISNAKHEARPRPLVDDQASRSEAAPRNRDPLHAKHLNLNGKHSLHTKGSTTSSPAAMDSSPTPRHDVAKPPHSANSPPKPKTAHPHLDPPDPRGPESQIRREMVAAPATQHDERPRKQRRLDADDTPVEHDTGSSIRCNPLSPKSLSDAQRREAHDAILEEEDGSGWHRIGLVSVSGYHLEREVEL